jgi:hypothetical protein
MDMARTQFALTATIVTFFAVTLVFVPVLWVIEAAYRNWRRGKASYRFFDRRRSKRFDISMPISVYGHESNTEPFFENATVVQVSAHGGLLTLASKVRIGQVLLLATDGAREVRQTCWVARLGSPRGAATEVAIKFARPAPEFWLSIYSSPFAS